MAEKGTTGLEAPRKVYALSKLAESIRVQIDKTFSGAYWITAEISKLNYYPQSGHCYPQLVEKHQGQIVADIRAFILNSRYKVINQKFRDTTGSPLADGMQILIRCKVGFHAIYGLSLNVVDIEPGYTMGEMARLRQQAMDQLKKDGLYTLNKELITPMLIRRLAVISVDTSKGWRDFSEILANSRFPKATSTRLFPALLQGDAAVGSIISALERIKKLRAEFDAVSIIRGGGGEVGLDCYDNYQLGRAISTFPIPVITGIGHATNLTVAELVAHKNLITPTDLARYISDGFDRFSDRVESAKKSLSQLRRGWYQMKTGQIYQLSRELGLVVSRRNKDEKARLNFTASELATAVKSGLDTAGKHLVYTYPARLEAEWSRTIRMHSNILEHHTAALQKNTPVLLKERAASLLLSAEKIRLLDPVNALKRGYSITFAKGKIIRSASELTAGDEIETIYAKGRSRSTVNTTEK